MPSARVIEITATCFESIRFLAQPADPALTSYVVHLKPLRPAVATAATVGVQELLHDNRARVARLQQQAADALGRADYVSVEQYLAQALELSPSDAAMAIDLGIVALRSGHSPLAEKWIERAFALAPTNSIALSNLGVLRWTQDRHTESRLLLERAVERESATPLSHYVLGLLYLEDGRPEASIRQLSHLPPERFRSRNLFLAVAYIGLGKTGDAAKSYRKFRQRNPIPLRRQVRKTNCADFMNRHDTWAAAVLTFPIATPNRRPSA